jgi:hypothetical protein
MALGFTSGNAVPQLGNIRGLNSNQSHLSDSPSNDNSQESKNLLEKAKNLRKEAGLLEQKLRETKAATATSNAIDTSNTNIPTKVTKLEDSVWKLSYRFSSQPKDDDEDTILPNYSGKLTIRLTPDGYSEIVSSTDTSNADNNSLVISKVWGWDVEYSQEDDQQYLLFSMDVQFPKSDPKRPNQVERCYFQARLDKEIDNTIVFQDGTVTVKKDVSEKTKGRWGLFQVGGILTEFRYVGDFIAKPTSATSAKSS